MHEFFELPDDDMDEKPMVVTDKLEIEAVTTEAYSNLEKIENALPQVRGLESADIEMDNLSQLAQDSYKDLMDLGFQVDSRFSAEIFNVAGTMLGHAITAKTAKINKKLKMIELQLKKALLDQKTANTAEKIEATPMGDGHLLDRNELLKILSHKKPLE